MMRKSAAGASVRLCHVSPQPNFCCLQAAGGEVHDGYLGNVSVSRALGDWLMDVKSIQANGAISLTALIAPMRRAALNVRSGSAFRFVMGPSSPGRLGCGRQAPPKHLLRKRAGRTPVAS